MQLVLAFTLVIALAGFDSFSPKPFHQPRKTNKRDLLRELHVGAELGKEDQELVRQAYKIGGLDM